MKFKKTAFGPIIALAAFGLLVASFTDTGQTPSTPALVNTLGPLNTTPDLTLVADNAGIGTLTLNTLGTPTTLAAPVTFAQNTLNAPLSVMVANDIDMSTAVIMLNSTAAWTAAGNTTATMSATMEANDDAALWNTTPANTAINNPANISVTANLSSDTVAFNQNTTASANNTLANANANLNSVTGTASSLKNNTATIEAYSPPALATARNGVYLATDTGTTVACTSFTATFSSNTANTEYQDANTAPAPNTEGGCGFGNDSLASNITGFGFGEFSS
jgi:hypothetical protein